MASIHQIFIIFLLSLFPVSFSQTPSQGLVRIAALIIANQNSYGLESTIDILNSYGIRYDIIKVGSSYGQPLVLESGEMGLYSVIIFVDGFISGLTSCQYQEIERYEIKYRVRRVGLNVWPNAISGIEFQNSAARGCCDTNVEHMLTFNESTLLETSSGVKSTAELTSIGLYHYPTKITDNKINKALLYSGPLSGVYDDKGVVAVIRRLPEGRSEMLFFLAFGSFSITSILLNHVWIAWAFRNFYFGHRRVYFTQQIDDMFLSTPLWNPATMDTDGIDWRITKENLVIHENWTKDFNYRLPQGSSYRIELGYNGNGICLQTRENPVSYNQDEVASYTFKKPPGTGVNLWPSKYNDSWGFSALSKDPLFLYSRDSSSFDWTSHSFTHLNMNNATYNDAFKEISENRKFASSQYLNLEGKSYFSEQSLIPPAITGLYNGDALKAWYDAGIRKVVGDNTRPDLVNAANRHWPLITTQATNGFDGMMILPRHATEIYYSVSTIQENLSQYNFIYTGELGETADFNTVLSREANRVVRSMLLLEKDAHMFHQANMRVNDLNPTRLSNGMEGKHSLLMTWAEFMVWKYKELVDWPIVSKNQKDLARLFEERMSRDAREYELYGSFENGQMKYVSIRANSPGKVPLSVPVDQGSSIPGTKEQLSPKDPVTYWVDAAPSARSYLLANPFPWN